jgi:hypothetical protein
MKIYENENNKIIIIMKIYENKKQNKLLKLKL